MSHYCYRSKLSPYIEDIFDLCMNTLVDIPQEIVELILSFAFHYVYNSIEEMKRDEILLDANFTGLKDLLYAQLYLMNETSIQDFTPKLTQNFTREFVYGDVFISKNILCFFSKTNNYLKICTHLESEILNKMDWVVSHDIIKNDK